MSIDHSSARYPHIRCVFRQHHVPPPALLRIVLQLRAAEYLRAFFHHQVHPGFEVDRGGEIGPRGEPDLAASGGVAGVDCRLDRGCVVVQAIADGSVVGDREEVGEVGELNDWLWQRVEP